MTDEISKQASQVIPKAVPKAATSSRNSLISPVWVIPVIAALIGGWLVFKSAVKDDVFVEVLFESASGIEAGKTPVKLRNVKVGEVTEVKFTEDLSEVVVVMELTGVSLERLTDTTKFWVIRPRIGAEGVSGLDTLLSGAFIEIDPGEGGEPQVKFKGLEEPQIYQLGNPGKTFILKAKKLGSISRGSSVKYRGITVGSVTTYKLSDDHSYVEVEIFIEAPHDKYITQYTRFWNISGISIELDAKGFDFDMESISSLVVGGIAFTNKYAPDNLLPAEENNVFNLYSTESPEIEEALTFGVPMKLYFDDGVSGLSIGAPVEYKGMRIGTVEKVGVETNKNKNEIVTYAMIDIEPERLPSDELNSNLSTEKRTQLVYKYFEHMINMGVRGQLKSNILTGQSLIVLDVFSDVKPHTVKYVNGIAIIPTMPETVTGLIKQINELLARLDSLPIENIGQNVDEAVENANDLIKSLNVEEGGMTGVQINEALNELSKAARSIRTMSEYLERHPEALIKGKRAE